MEAIKEDIIPEPQISEEPDREKYSEKRGRHFRFFGLGSLVYAIFFTFCLYRNGAGITYPFFIGGTLFYFCLSLKKLEITVKKDSAFYIVSLLLLGLSTAMTDSGILIMMNTLGIFVLLFAFMIHHFHEDAQWHLGKYVGAILRTAFGAVGMIGRPFSDCGHFIAFARSQKGHKEGKIQYILLGLVIAFPLLVVILILLASADDVFAFMFRNLFDSFYVSDNLILVLAMMVFSFFASYCVLARLEKRSIPDDISDRRTLEPVLAITVTGLLSVIYLVFCSIQINYLFIGNGELPYGLTYSQYAREGFFQLLFVCLINLSIVLICIGRFRESKLLNAIMTVITLCTFIMIASSAVRMFIYIFFYDLTFLRFFVLWSLLVLALLLCGVLVNIYRQKFPLFQYSMIVVTVLYLVLSFCHPDYWIARYNVSVVAKETASETEYQYADTDYDYLYSLSADAAPILLNAETKALFDQLDDPHLIRESNYYREKIRSMASAATLRTFNLSRYLAGKYL